MKKQADEITSALQVMADESSQLAALIDTEDDYRIIWANRALKEFLGRLSISPEGLHWGGRCPFAFGIDAERMMKKVADTGEPIRAEARPFGARVSSRFGETTYWNWKILPAPSESCPGCVLAMAENVTDHVARRATERERGMLLSGVVLDLPVGVAIVGIPDFNILDANDIWLSYLPPEYQTRDSIGKNLPECMPNFESSGLSDVLCHTADTKEVFISREYELRDPVRGSTWWSIAVRPVSREEDNDALLITTWEVTEQVNARRRIEQSRRRAEAMLRVQHAISSSLALDEVLGLITGYARELLHTPASSVFLLSEDGATYRPVGATGIELTDENTVCLTEENSLAARALREQRVVTLINAESTEARTLPLLENGRPVSSVAVAPIEAEDRHIGVIEVYNDENRRFTNDELEALTNLASTAATAIVNAELYEDAQRSRAELQKRNRALVNERSLLETILDSIPEAVTVIDADTLGVTTNIAAKVLLDLEEEEPITVDHLFAGIKPMTLDGKDLPLEDYPQNRVLRGDEFRSFEYMVIDDEGNRQYRSVSGAPVKDSQGKVIYGVTVGYDVTEQKMAQARLEEAYEREKKISQMLQQSLLPVVPKSLDGVTLAAKYEAGLTEAEIGGDFYDVFSLPEGKTAIVIGDVSGKGLNAAIQIAEAKYAIRSYAHEDPSPSNVISRVNDLLCVEPTITGFVTMFYALVDVKTHEIIYANAGHEPPLLRRANGQIEELHAQGIVLGVLPNYAYSEGTTELCPGDRMLLYTDGMSEARGEGKEQIGVGGLSRFWSEHARDGAEASLESIYSWAKDYSDGHFHDDVAIIVVAAEDESRQE